MSEYIAAKQQEYETKCRLPEVVVLEEARFTDKLEPEHEQAWSELLLNLNEGRKSSDDILKELWEDERVPRAFRDRLMLLLLGSDECQRTLRGDQRPWVSGIDNPLSYTQINITLLRKHIDNFNVTNFINWALECDNHQTDSSLYIIDRLAIQLWVCEAFESRILTENAFNQILDSHRLAEPQPYYSYDDDEGQSKLHPDRFPLVEDIYFNHIKEFNSPTRSWAREQANQWIAWKTGEIAEIPSWLQQATDEQGLQLYQQFTKALIAWAEGYKMHWQGKSRAGLWWDDINKAIDYFGMEVIFPEKTPTRKSADERSERFNFHNSRNDRLRRIAIIPDINIKQKGIIILLEESATLRKTKPWVEPLHYTNVADAEYYLLLARTTNNPDIISLAEQELQLTMAAHQKYEAEKASREVESKRKYEQDPAEMTKKLALKSLEKIVSELRREK